MSTCIRCDKKALFRIEGIEYYTHCQDHHDETMEKRRGYCEICSTQASYDFDEIVFATPDDRIRKIFEE